jgi:peptidoglycan hydrolase-like protein with peptidoglycan-binding domain
MPQIALSDCRALETNPGFSLRTDAAIAWDRAVRKFGKRVLLTGAWRSYETQVRLFKERYAPGRTSPYNDYRTWYTSLGGDGRVWGRFTGAAAAVPGTSNHGGGIAVDVKTSRSAGDPGYAIAVVFTSFSDADRLEFLRDAQEFGWDDAEGRQVGELWHLTYYPGLDEHRGKSLSTAVIYLKRGTSNASGTRTLQAFLKDKFRPNLVVDGDYGPATEEAVKHWQRKAGLKPAGVIGPVSRARLVRLGVFEPLED